MKKVFTPLLIAMLAMSSCTKVSSDDLDEDVPYYQHYNIIFDASANSTNASGIFRVRSSQGSPIKLDGVSNLKVNGNASVEHIAFSVPSYASNITGIADVTFLLTKKDGKTITNTIAANSIEPVGFPSGMATNFSRSAGISFSYTGTEGAIEVIVTGEDIGGSAVTQAKTFTTSQVTFSSAELSSFNNGEIQIELVRRTSNNIPNSDGNSGGTADVKYSAHRTFMLNT